MSRPGPLEVKTAGVLAAKGTAGDIRGKALQALYETKVAEGTKLTGELVKTVDLIIRTGGSVEAIQKRLGRHLNRPWPELGEVLLDSVTTAYILGNLFPAEQFRAAAMRAKAADPLSTIYAAKREPKKPVPVAKVVAMVGESHEWDDIADAFAEKTTLPPEAFYELNAELRQKYFTISSAEHQRLLGKYQGITEDALREGWSLDTYKQAQYRVTSTAGLKPLRPWHLETVFRNNIQISYGASRWEMYSDPDVQDLIKALMWAAQMDERTRDEHANLHGTTAPIDDPFWADGTSQPPVDWSCRCDCHVITIYDKDVKMQRPPDNWRELMNPDFMFNKSAMLRQLPPTAAGAAMIGAQAVGEIVLAALLKRAEKYAFA